MKKSNSAVLIVCSIVAFMASARAQSTVIEIDAGKVVGKVSPTLYGLMTEEINYSYDGGLYAELIQNRAFLNTPEDNRGGRGGRGAAPATEPSAAGPVILHWSLVQSQGAQGKMALDTTNPVNTVALKTSLKLDITSVGTGQRVGVANDGYWGIPVRPNTTYRASFYAKGGNNFRGPLNVAIESNDGNTIFATGAVAQISSDWMKYTVNLKTAQVAPTAAARFVISAGSPGTVWLNLVSLFPPTYNNRPNGNRIDLMKMLVDMKPAFLRFPGGNYVEGRADGRYNWKEMIHDISLRPTHRSPWSYRSTDGMGHLEFLEWCEDMHAEPVMAVFAGFTLNGAATVATGEKLKPFVQDALDEIEYTMGDISTPWGMQRALDGHPQPFKLTYVEIGNEDNLGGGGPTYDERFAAFYDAIKAKYPQIQIIATTAVRGRTPDVVDEHNYMTAEVAMQQAHRFDRRPRTGAPKIFMGEWATRIGSPTTNLQAGLADAAFMTGLERNSDIVIMSCYAPLFVNVNPGGMQWPSDLIGYDVMNSYGCPSYYVQKMFSDYLGNELPQLTVTGIPTKPYTPPAGRGRGRGAAASAPATAPAPPPPAAIQLEQMYSSVTRDSAKGAIYLKVVNCSETPQPTQINIKGVTTVADQANCVVLSSANQADTNSITEPTKIVPVTTKINGVKPSFTHTFPPYSVTILQIDGK